MNRRIPPSLRGFLLLGLAALGLSACAVYPAGGGYGPRYGGGWRAAPPAYAYAAPARPHWGHGGGWGHGWGHHGRGHHRHHHHRHGGW
jgi:hypothetical protein